MQQEFFLEIALIAVSIFRQMFVAVMNLPVLTALETFRFRIITALFCFSEHQ